MTNKSSLIEIVENDGKILFRGKITDLPLREDYIIATSVELYREKEPCIIYRTHIMKKFYIRLYEELSVAQNTDILCNHLSEYFNKVDLALNQARVRFVKC